VKRHLTTREVGSLLDQPEWFVRRIVDALSPSVERFGHKRLIPSDRVTEIKAAIDQHLRRREGRKVVAS